MSPVLIPPRSSRAPSGEIADPAEFRTFGEGMDAVDEEKRRALADPGLSWRHWLFFQALKWWLVLALFVLDVWIVLAWLTFGSTAGAVLSIALAVYLEFLLYRFLWYRPQIDGSRRRRAFRRTWTRPAEFGRWTPEAETARAGGSVYSVPEGPRREDFL